MIKSMTGYGSAKGEAAGQQISIEIRGVNNRYLDCSVRIPRIYMFSEDALKKQVKGKISRGKVDIFVNVDSSKSDDTKIEVNKPLARAYLQAVRDISQELDLQPGISAFELSGLPDVTKTQKTEPDAEKFTEELCEVLTLALRSFDAMRETEGKKLFADIEERLDCIEGLTQKIEARSPLTVTEYREKLEQRISELLQDSTIDKGRILTEAAIFADKVAVSEETTRIDSHISQMRKLLSVEEAVGRKLDFLLQELNREANTIGSKANDTEMSELVIDLKAEIEKIREQAQNIE